MSHFYPIPFPQNKYLLMACVAGYVLCATVYYLIERNLEGDHFYVSSTHSMTSLKDFPRISLSSELDTATKPGEASYTLHLTGQSSRQATRGFKVDKKASVTDFVDEKGYVHRYKVREYFEECVKAVIN